MSDLKIKLQNAVFDFVKQDQDFAIDDGLETAIIVSLFSDKRVSLAEVRAGVVDTRGGWWGSFVEGQIETGSEIWLFERRKLTTQVAADIEDEAVAALQWMLGEGSVDKIEVTTVRPAINRLNMVIAIIKGNQPPRRFEFILFWEGEDGS